MPLQVYLRKVAKEIREAERGGEGWKRWRSRLEKKKGNKYDTIVVLKFNLLAILVKVTKVT